MQSAPHEGEDVVVEEVEAVALDEGVDAALDPEEARALAFVLESVLFASGRPLGVRDLIAVMTAGGRAELSAKDIRAAVSVLLDEYAPGRRGIVLHEIGGGFQFRTARENAEWVRQVFKEKPARLGRATLETLAIVAYRQPATKAEVESVRGVDADAALGTLLARRLIKIAGRKEAIGRPLLYATTPEFLEVFGLKSLRDLPALEELAAIAVEEEIDEQEATDESDEGARGGEAGDDEYEGGEDLVEFAAEDEFEGGEGSVEFAAEDEFGVEGDGDAGASSEEGAAPATEGDDGLWPQAAAAANESGGDEAADAGGPDAAGADARATPEDLEPSRDRLAEGGRGDAPRGTGERQWEGDQRTGDEGEPPHRSDPD